MGECNYSIKKEDHNKLKGHFCTTALSVFSCSPLSQLFQPWFPHQLCQCPPWLCSLMALAALRTPLVHSGIKICFDVHFSSLPLQQRNWFCCKSPSATEEKLKAYIFLKVIWLRISYSASQGNRHYSNYTQNRAPMTLHNTILHAFSSRSVHPEGELVIVNYSRKANPMWQVVYTTLWASSWLASCSFRVLHSRQGSHAHSMHMESTEMAESERIKSSEPTADTHGHTFQQITHAPLTSFGKHNWKLLWARLQTGNQNCQQLDRQIFRDLN